MSELFQQYDYKSKTYRREAEEGRERGWRAWMKAEMVGREGGRERETHRETERERRERQNSNALFYKDCSLSSVKSLSNN